MPVPPYPIRAVLFDLDGTLIETHIDFPAMTRSMQAMARDARVPEEVIAGRDILSIVRAAAGDIAGRGGDGPAFRQEAFAALEEMEVAGCASPTLLPGTEALLDDLRSRGIKVGVVTRNCRRVSAGLLEQFSLPHDALLTRDDVAHTKPDPQHLWDALAALGHAPSEAAMVGDHWMDIQAGRRAGVALTVGVLGHHAPDWFAPCPPDALARDLAEAEGRFR
ncbi:MAG: HAD family hydrolase [Armatimonadetes bacterium]|nr:HAD family hydrolase [Armatimonadota bacterium]